MSIVKNLFKYYPASDETHSFRLDIPSLEILETGITALSGPSGSGKTTLLRILLGLESCQGYSWMYQGKDLAKLSPGERHIGVVFQNSELFPHMTARENIQFAADARGQKGSADQFLDTWNSRLQLHNCLDRNVGLLSGGERQRVALARCLASSPQILLLDEPFSALDEVLRQGLRLLIKEVVTELNLPCVLVTHDQRDIDAIADTVVYMREGKIVPQASKS